MIEKEVKEDAELYWDYVVSRRVVCVYECEFASAKAVLDAVLGDTRYRSHSMCFLPKMKKGDTPMVEIEVEFVGNI